MVCRVEITYYTCGKISVMDMMKCPACAKKIPDNSNFCPVCGFAITEEDRRTKGSILNTIGNATGAGCLTVALLAILAGAVVVGKNTFFTSPYPEIHRSAAIAICGTAFEEHTKNATRRDSQSATVFEEQDQWVVRLPGEVWGGLDGWRKVVIHCRCMKNNPDPDDEISPEALLEIKVVPVPESK